MMNDRPVYIGVEIGGTKLQVAAVSDSGKILTLRRAKVRRGDGAAGIRAQILAELKALELGRPPTAVGVGFGGPVDFRTGVVARSFQVDGWTGFPLAQWLSDELQGVPVCVENDANAAALAEAVYGAGRGHSPVLYSNSGSGVGAGLVVEGQLYRGRSSGEMELGHLWLDTKKCTVEDRASGWSVDQRVREHAQAKPAGRLAALVGAQGRNGGEAEVLAQAVSEKDAAAEAILDETARDYAYGISHAVHLLNPEIIVLGGGVSLLAEPWRAMVERHLSNFLMEAFRPGPPIVLAGLGESAVPLGAALLASRRFPAGQSARPGRLHAWIDSYLEAQHRTLAGMRAETIEPLVRLLAEASAANRQIFVCGNGGNAANASHFATDLGKSASDAMPRPFRVLSINDNVSWITAIGNDYTYDDVFVRQIANYAQPGDLLIVSSVSGNSPNVIRALEWSRTKGLKTVALVGAKAGRAAELADHVVIIPDTHYGRVEDMQMTVLHMLCYAFKELPDLKTAAQ